MLAQKNLRKAGAACFFHSNLYRTCGTARPTPPVTFCIRRKLPKTDKGCALDLQSKTAELIFTGRAALEWQQR